MARRFRCKNCGATSGIQDAGSNWNPLGRRNGKPMFACDCGHGIFVGIFGTSYVRPETVEDQKKQMRKAGLEPDLKLPTAGDIEKAMREAPPGDTHFEVGDRITNPMGSTGTVKDVYEESGKPMLKVLFDVGYGDTVVSVDPSAGKIRRLEVESPSEQNTSSVEDDRSMPQSPPARAQWSTLALNLAVGLERVRESWFQACIDALRDQSANVARSRLTGEASQAIRAWQLYWTSSFLAQHEYIPPDQGQDFADILYAQVCGTEMTECLRFMRRYHEKEDDRGSQLFIFTSDVAKYITGDETPLMEAMLIGTTTPAFTAMNHMVVATCFGDEDTVKKLEANLQKER